MTTTLPLFAWLPGALAVALLFATLPFIRPTGVGTSELIGYISSVGSALALGFWIRSHLERAGGWLTFRCGLGVGVLTTLISDSMDRSLS